MSGEFASHRSRGETPLQSPSVEPAKDAHSSQATSFELPPGPAIGDLRYGAGYEGTVTIPSSASTRPKRYLHSNVATNEASTTDAAVAGEVLGSQPKQTARAKTSTLPAKSEEPKPLTKWQKLWQRLDEVPEEPIDPLSLVGAIREEAQRRVEERVPGAALKTYAGQLVVAAAVRYSESHYLANSTNVQQSLSGFREKALGKKLPNTVQHGRNGRLRQLSEKAITDGLFETVIDPDQDAGESARQAFDQLDATVYRNDMDGVYYVDGVPTAIAIERNTRDRQTPYGKDDWQAITARMDMAREVERPGSTGRTFETVFLIQSQQDRSMNLIASIRPGELPSPGERSIRAKCIVEAVTLHPNMVTHVTAALAQRSMVKQQAAGEAVTFVQNAGVEVDLPRALGWLQNEQDLGRPLDLVEPQRAIEN